MGGKSVQALRDAEKAGALVSGLLLSYLGQAGQESAEVHPERRSPGSVCDSQ